MKYKRMAIYFCIDFNINFREYALSPTEQQNPEHVSTGDLAPKLTIYSSV